MKLLIVESPAKAKTISKYLEGKYTVKASVGHVRDLPKSNKKAIDIEGGFIPHYEISKDKEKVVSEIEELAGKANEILLATDPDREGEAIAWHLAELINDGPTKSKTKSKLLNVKRVTYHEITKEAIKEALEHPRAIDQNLRRAQEARRVLDRLVGYDLSGLIWKKVRYGLSAGRVQSPALRIIVEREREIRAFKPETFWVISADVESKTGGKFTLFCVEEPRDKALVDKILEVGNRESWVVSDLSETEAKRSPKAPFITSTLQQAASSRLGFAPSRTMGIAQKLYEAGLITYMRTDSTTLSAQALGQIPAVIEKKFGKGLSEARTFAKKSKNAQEAHEAIRPTDLSVDSAGASDEAKKLYELIWARTIASQMADAKILRSKITVKVGNYNDRIPDFAINGTRVLSQGWLLADPDARGEDVELPKVTLNEKLKLLELKTEEKQTEPPPRYSEAGLVKELEKRGIGRPSTYASIIKTIEDRGYVTKETKALKPTDTGEVVSGFLEENFPTYISDTFTAEMEDKLDDIALGTRDYVKTLSEFYTPFLKEVKSKDKMEKATNLGEGPKEFPCPICKGLMIIKLGKTGRFLSCEKFPDCLGARKIDGTELEGPKETGEMCPECKTGKLIERDGKFGRFIACNNYPKCKHIKKDAELEKKNSTGVTCPMCKEGMMTERRGRFGLFYSCSNYPKCKNAIKAKPTGKLCPTCGALMMLGTKTIPERCSDKLCPNHNPHKLTAPQ
ncbi:MAG: topoisomerase protein [Parcubacteria group bacterium GW2011_GWA2_47_16]|nr:MAG: topoisomerase protein [Parcubacteria group bacterium GW2011_GWA2_47_16]